MGDRIKPQYVRSRDGYLAYAVSGSGPVDVLLRSYGTISFDAFEREPRFAEFLARLERFSRVIRFDVRGVGLSDPLDPAIPPSIEADVEDAVAVLDAVGSERAAVLGLVWHGPWALVFGATHPQRTAAVVMCNTFVRTVQSDDFPLGFPEDKLLERIDSVTDPEADVDASAFHAPSLTDDDAFRTWWVEEGQRGASPRSARALVRASFFADARSALRSIQAPTLVFQREWHPLFEDPLAMARYIADAIPDTRIVVLKGVDSFPFSEGGTDLIAGELEELLTGSRREREPERVLATVLFTDIVESTARAAQLRDREWRQILDRHDAMVRRQFERFGGREIKTTGDGFLATFEGPARGVRCALAISEGAAQLGVDVRAGVHTGEVELRGDDIHGIGVHLAQRVSAKAGAGEVLVSRTVKDLVFGSELEFRERGSQELKGIPGTWELFEVAAPDP